MRYTPHTEDEIGQMLEAIGARSIEDLFASIPKHHRFPGKLDVPEALSEPELMRHFSDLAMRNKTLSCQTSFIGAGAYRHYCPAAVTELAGRSEFVTPYTPYQPEISQGTLAAIFEYQSQICRLFAMDVSNASHYSGATAMADAALMARRIKKGQRKIVLPLSVHPEYRHVLRTQLLGDDDIVEIPTRPDGTVDRNALTAALAHDVAAVIAQFPNFFGAVEDLTDVAAAAHAAGALFIAVVPEPIALGILAPPGDWGADVAVGEGLSLGLPLNFGGPTLGIFTARQALVRNIPGRICGKTVDADGRPGYVLTLSTREQHIRREKATSNICSNQALCATTAAMYMALCGKEGFRELATLNAAKASYARDQLTSIPGVEATFSAPTFNEFTIRTKKPAAALLSSLSDAGILGGVDLGRWYPNMENDLLVCTTELNSRDEIDRYAEHLSKLVR
jgi:glycine dehydrogenase subunit 1